MPESSYQRMDSSKSSRNCTRTPGELPIRPIFGQQINNTNDETNIDTLVGSNSDSDLDDAENELNDDFMNEKHESDRNYLNQLKQITQNSELKVESNTDFSLLKNRRNIASRENSFLYSPAPSARNNSGSKLSNYSSSQRANSAKGQHQRPVIPPADKTMEVVVGKGRRGSVSSARSNANATPTSNRPPQTPKSTGKSASTGNFACSHCPKRYNNKKDLDIHSMYCT